MLEFDFTEKKFILIALQDALARIIEKFKKEWEVVEDGRNDEKGHC